MRRRWDSARRRLRRPVRIGLVAVGVMALLFCGAAALIATAGLTDSAAAGDVVVVLGNITTRATAINAASIMEQRGWTSAIIATQYFHVARTQLAFEQAGIGSVTTVHAHHNELRDLYSLAREVPAYLSYRLSG